MIKEMIKKFWPTSIVLAVIVYATLSNDPIGADELPLIPHIDKLIHAIMMGGLFSAIVFDLCRNERQKLATKRLIGIAVGVMIFCIFDEIAQTTLTDTRSGDPLDLLADWVGIWIAYFAAPPAIKYVLKIKTD